MGPLGPLTNPVWAVEGGQMGREAPYNMRTAVMILSSLILAHIGWSECQFVIMISGGFFFHRILKKGNFDSSKPQVVPNPAAEPTYRVSPRCLCPIKNFPKVICFVSCCTQI